MAPFQAPTDISFERYFVRAVKLTLSLALVTGIVYAGFVSIRYVRGKDALDQLLNGDEQIHIVQLRIEYQQRRIICTNAQSLRYIEAQMRVRSLKQPNGGPSYLSNFWFSNGGFQSVYSSWGGDGFVLFFGDDREIERPVFFSAPIPEKVGPMLRLLQARYEDVAGTVLTVNDKQELTEYDTLLDLR